MSVEIREMIKNGEEKLESTYGWMLVAFEAIVVYNTITMSLFLNWHRQTVPACSSYLSWCQGGG